MGAVQAARPIRVNIYYSADTHSYWADSPDLNGLAASGKTRAEVQQEALWAAETLFELKGIHAEPMITFQDAVFDSE